MATIASFNTANPGNSSSITVTKPTGLAVGDLMIFHYSYSDATDLAQTMSGWTHEVDNYGGVLKTGIQWKIADAGDVAASNFTMSFDGAVASPLAGLLRITGYVVNDLLNEAKDTGANGDGSLSVSVTPITPNSLILFFIANNEQSNISNYAIATDNPSWSELYDITGSSVTGLALGYATRTQVTATGEASFNSSVGSGTIDFFGILIAIGTPLDVTISPSVLSSVVSVQEPTVAGGAIVSPAVISSVVSVQAPVVSMPAQKFTNESKHDTDWVNEDKS